MNKIIFFSILALFVGIAIGAAGMLLAFPYLFPPDEVNEVILDKENKTEIASGNFIHPDPDDPLHWGKGSVSVYQSDRHHEVLLEPDFEVGPGPDYYLYLSSGEHIQYNDAFHRSEHIQIGRLKSFSGSQVFQINHESEIRQYKSIVVWCRTFKMLITSADLTFQ